MSRGYIVRRLWAGEGIGRVLMNLEIARAIHLSGLVLDVGGRGNPSYRDLFGQSDALRFVVIDLAADPTVDVSGSITALPLITASFDTVLCFNVLEHVYDFETALSEMRRVLKPGGTLYGRVPFLLGVHADPSDHWRFTAETLGRLLKATGFQEVEVTPQGGLFLVICNLLGSFLRIGLIRLAVTALAVALDHLLSLVIGKERNRERYPMGYGFVAR
jgi:SAM-dependent methyltransferase